MAKTTSSLWDASEHLKSNEDRGAYLEAALDDDLTLFADVDGALLAVELLVHSRLLNNGAISIFEHIEKLAGRSNKQGAE